MKKLTFVLSFLFVTSSLAVAQFPEIMEIPTSAEANGIGDIAASIPSSEAMATFANPAQLGIFSLSGFFNASTYVTKTPWLRGTNYSGTDFTLNASAANVGINLGRYLDLPIGCSIGAGYSSAYFDEGSPFWYTYKNNVFDTLGASPEWQKQENYTIGLGVDWLIKLGLGYSFEIVNLEEGGYYDTTTGIYSLPGKTNAHSFGVMVQIPVAEIVSRLADQQIMLTPKLQPTLDINLGYARRNIGDAWVHIGSNSGVGLVPRSATLGLNFEIGLRTTVQDRDWNLFSLTWAREAEDVLIAYSSFSQGVFTYESGLGDIEPFNNLVLGKQNGYVDVRKGWQVQLAELVYIRGGSDGGGWTYYVSGTYYTFGASVALNGLLKLLGAFHIVDIQNGPFAFLVYHLDLQYDYSRYSSGQPFAAGLNGTTFKAVNLVIK